MLEVFAIFLVALFIAVLFYKQGNESFEILQLEADRLEDLPTLYSEHSPIVIRGFQTPALGSQTDLEKRPQIMQMGVATNLSMKALLGSEGSLSNYTWKPQTASFLSKETGLDTWFQLQLFTSLLPSSYTKWMYSNKTSLWPHHRGLFKTTAFQTVLMPTQGTVRVSLMLPKVEAYLPVNWKGRQFSSLKLADTPLLAQIQFIEVKLRKGNLMLLPAHLIADIRTDEESKDVKGGGWCFVAEIHHFISRLVPD